MSSCKMFYNIVISYIHETAQKRKQTLDSAQYGLKIIFNFNGSRFQFMFIIQNTLYHAFTWVHSHQFWSHNNFYNLKLSKVQ